MTAAHGVDQDTLPSEYEVIVGSQDVTATDGTVVEAAEIILHPNYVEGADNDIALIRLASAVAAPTSRLISPGRMGGDTNRR